MAYAKRLGMVDALGHASPGTIFAGGCTSSGFCYATGPAAADDPRPIAIPSYLWGGTSGRPVYVLATPDDFRPDLFRYDVDGVEKWADPTAAGAQAAPTAGAGIVPLDPAGTLPISVLNPIVVTANGVEVAKVVADALGVPSTPIQYTASPNSPTAATSRRTWVLAAAAAAIVLLAKRH